MDKTDAALAWAARGFRVFPLRPNAKEPIQKGWTSTATADPLEVMAIWSENPEANIGVLTDNLVVVDIDMKNGKDGLKSYADLGLPLDTLLVRTPTGGYHAYFSGPNVALSAGKLGEGLDIRSYHGYVIAPGSEIGDGSYTVDHDVAMRPVPEGLLARLSAPRTRKTSAEVLELDDPRDVQRASAYLDKAAPAVEGSGGDARTYEVICGVKDIGVSEDVALALLLDRWNDRCDPPWEDEHLELKVRNAYLYGTSEPGVHSIRVAEEGTDWSSIPGTSPEVSREKLSRSWIDHGETVPTDTRWLIHNLLPATGVALLTAPAGSGKTFLALELGRCIATGKPFFGTQADDIGGVVCIYAGTEGSGLSGRLAALQEPNHIPLAATRVTTISTKEGLEQLALDIAEKSAEMVRTFGVPVRLIIVETLSALGLIKDENDNTAAAEAMGALGRMSEALGALVLVTHHPPKDGTGERGAGAIRGSADYILAIEKDSVYLKRLELTKARDAAERHVGMFTLIPVVVGIDDKERDIISLSVSMGEGRRAPQAPGAYDILEQAYGVSDLVEVQGQRGARVADVLTQFDALHDARTPAGKKRAFDSAMEWAERSGAMKLVHHEGERYVIKGDYNDGS